MKLISSLLLIFILLKSTGFAFGQCSGNVLFKEDFGGEATSSEWGTALDNSTTSYIFLTQADINDGYYTIRKHSGPMFNWFPNGTDHTGNGYMMIVNADFQPGLFYSKTITGLCQGSKFYFSAWIANLLPKNQYQQTPLDPGVKFEIRTTDTDSLIGSLSTGTIGRFNEFTWVEYGISFDLPPNQSAVKLLIFNDQPGGNGNDLALDDIEFTLCGPPVHTSFSGTYKNTNDICEGSPVSFAATIDKNYYKNPQYQWQFSKDGSNWNDIPGATTLNYQINNVSKSDSGQYRFLTSDLGNIDSRNCRITTAPIPLNVYQPVRINASSNSPLCEGDTIFLQTNTGIAFQWAGPLGFNSTMAKPVLSNAQLSMNGRYNVYIITSGGCESQTYTEVKVRPNMLQLNLGSDTTLCEGKELELNASNTGASYQWNDGSILATKMVSSPGNYSVKVIKGVCSKKDSIKVAYTVLPHVKLGNDTTICSGEPLILNAATPDAKQYQWQDGSMDPVYNVQTTGVYIVAVGNECGETKDTVVVNAGACADELLLPSAFTPNNDGTNDIFHPRITFAVQDYLLLIYNRWGNLVFKSNNIRQGWDGSQNGKILNPGSYVWKVNYKKSDGSERMQTGTILLIR